jgi:ectoine hydroxylase
MVIASDLYPTRSANEPCFVDRADPVVYGRAEDGPLDAGTLAAYERNGYLTVDRLLTSEELERCRAELHRLSRDPDIRADRRTITETSSDEVRSVFEVHKISDVFAELARRPNIIARARQILGSDVYIHQSRINYKPGFVGRGFYWHSDFETWHAEDGMPRMRAVSISIALTANYPHNGALMIIAGSHRVFASCAGHTPDQHYKTSLQAQEIGTPHHESLRALASDHNIDVLTGPAGSAVMFDSNCMHGSSDNITPFPRANLFVVFNSMENACIQPYAASSPRPEFVASRDFLRLS